MAQVSKLLSDLPRQLHESDEEEHKWLTISGALQKAGYYINVRKEGAFCYEEIKKASFGILPPSLPLHNCPLA